MANRAPFIYIIGPLHGENDADILDNIEKAESAAYEIQCKAHNMNIPIITFCPHSETGWWLVDSETCEKVAQEEHLYMRAYLSLLMSGKVDAVYFIGSSPGADVELMVAENMGIPVLRDAVNVETFLLDRRDKQCG